MTVFITTLLISLLINLLVIKFEHIHIHLSSDHLKGPQKIHAHIVSRIGGLSIMLALIITTIGHSMLNNEGTFNIKNMIILTAIPIFLIGFSEDLLKKLSVKFRLTLMLAITIIVVIALQLKIKNVDIQAINYMLNIGLISILFTTFCLIGLTNSFNIIDGLNGLVSMTAIINFLAYAYISYKVNDPVIIFISLNIVAATIGFFICNYPKGLIFMGDGGAYLIGFMSGTIAILITQRNPQVSPWSLLLINAYPVFEALYSIWRRRIVKQSNPGIADNFHLHSIIHKKIIRWATNNKKNKTDSQFKNSQSTPFLWLLSSAAVFPALIFYNNSLILQIFFVIFCLTYILLYSTIINSIKINH